jgi:hypothetical protein
MRDQLGMQIEGGREREMRIISFHPVNLAKMIHWPHGERSAERESRRHGH